VYIPEEYRSEHTLNYSSSTANIIHDRPFAEPPTTYRGKRVVRRIRQGNYFWKNRKFIVHCFQKYADPVYRKLSQLFPIICPSKWAPKWLFLRRSVLTQIAIWDSVFLKVSLSVSFCGSNTDLIVLTLLAVKRGI